jgi:hypothetical protein
METKGKVDMLIWDDRCITTSELCATPGIRKLAVMAIIREFGYRKVCSRWVPKMLTVLPHPLYSSPLVPCNFICLAP